MGRSQGTIALLTVVIVLVALVNSVEYVQASSLTIDSQAGSGDCFPFPSCSVTLSTTNANDIILVLAGGGGANGLNFGTPTATGLTFNTRDTFYTVLPNFAPAANGVGEWWAVASSALSSETITLTESVTGADYAMIAYAISGANTVTPFDPDVVLPATAQYSCALCFPLASSSTVAVSTTNPNDMIFGIVGGGSDIGGGSAGTSGFTPWSVFGNPAAAEYDIVSSTQSGLAVTINFGVSPGSNWSMIGDAVQAAPSVSLSANPSTVMVAAGSSASTTITFHIIGTPPIGSPTIACGGLPAGASCSTTPSSLPLSVPDGYQFTLTITASSLTALGTYSVTVQASYGAGDMIQPGFFAISGIQFGSSGGIAPSAISIQQVASPSVTITVTVNAAPPIPEYPLGLPLLAIFMIIAYGLIKRRTRNPEDT